MKKKLYHTLIYSFEPRLATQNPSWTDTFSFSLSNERMIRLSDQLKRRKIEEEEKKVEIVLWDYNVIGLSSSLFFVLCFVSDFNFFFLGKQWMIF